MKNLIKSFLATLMLMVLLPTNVMAWVDCYGLEGYKKGSLRDDYDEAECEKFQMLYGNTDRDWVSKTTGIIRKANVEWDGVNRYVDGGENISSDSSNSSQSTPAQEVVKETMSMEEVRAYKFDPAENAFMTPANNLIAKTLIEEYDLWAVFKKAGGKGIYYVLKENGLEYAGGEITDYSQYSHAGNIFIYIFSNYSIKDIKEKLGIKFSDFSEMGIDPDDFYEGKVSSKELYYQYGFMIAERMDKNEVSVSSLF